MLNKAPAIVNLCCNDVFGVAGQSLVERGDARIEGWHCRVKLTQLPTRAQRARKAMKFCEGTMEGVAGSRESLSLPLALRKAPNSS